jgi:nicotinate-nucleotide pyrophosphorylase
LASFLEIEVRSKASAVAAARAFQELQGGRETSHACPCLLLLDNMTTSEISGVAEALRAQNLIGCVLLEASGNILPENLEAYAACGADALSMGVLTHSPRALDFRQKLLESDEGR